MDTSTARALIALNNSFYVEHAVSFSATRSAPWEGWRRLVEILGEHGWARHGLPQTTGREDAGPIEQPSTVLDLACGSLRFEHFLIEALPESRLEFHAVDNCPALAQSARLQPAACAFRSCDILESLMLGNALLPEVPACRLSVCFGFMHHVPGAELKQKVLDVLLHHTAPGGLAVLSFWQFMDDDRLAGKAARADDALRATSAPRGIDIAQLDANDHFLGWQADPSPLRYCHHFDEREIDELVASVGTVAREVARYSSDGASGTLNRYLVLERLP